MRKLYSTPSQVPTGQISVLWLLCFLEKVGQREKLTDDGRTTDAALYHKLTGISCQLGELKLLALLVYIPSCKFHCSRPYDCFIGNAGQFKNIYDPVIMKVGQGHLYEELFEQSFPGYLLAKCHDLWYHIFREEVFPKGKVDKWTTDAATFTIIFGIQVKLVLP